MAIVLPVWVTKQVVCNQSNVDGTRHWYFCGRIELYRLCVPIHDVGLANITKCLSTNIHDFESYDHHHRWFAVHVVSQRPWKSLVQNGCIPSTWKFNWYQKVEHKSTQIRDPRDFWNDLTAPKAEQHFECKSVPCSGLVVCVWCGVCQIWSQWVLQPDFPARKINIAPDAG